MRRDPGPKARTHPPETSSHAPTPPRAVRRALPPTHVDTHVAVAEQVRHARVPVVDDPDLGEVGTCPRRNTHNTTNAKQNNKRLPGPQADPPPRCN
eukprot:9806636-Alexandrium_andersonii.AAC.1